MMEHNQYQHNYYIAHTMRLVAMRFTIVNTIFLDKIAKNVTKLIHNKENFSNFAIGYLHM